MENSARFIIIAGIILVVIILIALGVRILQSAGQTSEHTDTTITEVDGALNSATSAVGNAVIKMPTN